VWGDEKNMVVKDSCRKQEHDAGAYYTLFLLKSGSMKKE
jgi:hypothetical protein